MQAVLRMKHYSIRTERIYLDWIKRDILFHHKTHPSVPGAPEVEAFLSYLAVAGQCDAGKNAATLAGGVDGERWQISAKPVGWDVVIDGVATVFRLLSHGAGIVET